jgi:molybdopterin-containing oxidoreductase family membrane subunit
MRSAALVHLNAPAVRLGPVVGAVFALLAAGLAAFLAIEINGHQVTGMSQRVPWGVPHVFAYFLILAASGAINVAMLAAVFGRTLYKPVEPLSALLAIALLLAGLTILVVDLGRPDRVMLTLFERNNRSIFAWNTVLYGGFLALAAAHLATLLNRRYGRFSPVTGHAVNLWRFALTTGTGLDLGVLIARDLYQSAMFAPLFISYALTFGLAVFLLVLPAVTWMAGSRPEEAIEQRLGRLLALFVAISLYLSLALHAFNLYTPAGRTLVRWLWLEGGVYTALLWGGQVLVGTLLPLLLIAGKRPAAAAGAVVVGAVATLYVWMIAAQAFPQTVLPGLQIASPYGDGSVASYLPTWPEWLLGLGGVAVAPLVLLAGCLLFRVVPPRRTAAAVGASAGAAAAEAAAAEAGQ